MKLTFEFDIPEDRFKEVFKAIVDSRGELSRADAAKLTRLSPSRFSREFKRIHGHTFRSMRQRVKVRVAAEIILTTRLRISEVAETVGYWEIRKFERAFKREFGMSPQQYRKRHFRAHETTAAGLEFISASEQNQTFLFDLSKSNQY